MTDLTRSSFDAFTARDELSTLVANSAVTGAPFARTLTPLPTGRGGVAFPRANPQGFGWVGEGAPIPAVDLNDDAHVVATAKLAGLITMSNEFIDDNELPISEMIGQTVADSMGPSLDSGLLYGAGAPAPTGVVASAPTAADVAEDMRQAVILAWGELVDAGANAETIVAFARGTTIARELGRNSSTMDIPIYRDGTDAMVGPGIRLIAVPSIAANQVLCVDVARTYLVLRSDFEASMSGDARFANDQTVMRVKGRFAAAAPTPAKSMRIANFEAPGSGS